jgi:hypothetical protein
MAHVLQASRNRIALLLVALVTAVVSLSAGQQASAHHYDIGYSFPEFMKAGQIGINAWGDSLNHCTQMTIYAYSGAQEYPEFADAYAFAWIGGCEVYFNVDARKNYKWNWFCSTMVHEMGHSAGLEHNELDRRDIMNAHSEVYWRKCLTRQQAAKMKARGKIIDRSIASWAYARATASQAGQDEVTRSDIERAIKAGELDVHPLGSISVP